jgi:hypothetical protein
MALAALDILRCLGYYQGLGAPSGAYPCRAGSRFTTAATILCKFKRRVPISTITVDVAQKNPCAAMDMAHGLDHAPPHLRLRTGPSDSP